MDERLDRAPELVGLAHVAAHQPGNPAPVLSEEWPVYAELAVEILHGTLGGQRAEDGPAGITRQHLPRKEYNHAEEPERDNPQSVRVNVLLEGPLVIPALRLCRNVI